MMINETENSKILVVDDQVDMLVMLKKVISRKCGGTTVRTSKSADKALTIADTWLPDVVLTDIRMAGMDGMEFLRKLVEIDNAITVIIMTGYGTISMAVQAFKTGAYDFFEKPFDNDKIVHTLNRAIERSRLLRENRRLHSRLDNNDQASELVGQSQKMKQILELLTRLAKSSATVLIRGESGTGKELAARTLHKWSERAKKKMVVVNCPALPEHILESELFGYCRGAFTGAEQDKKGLFPAADGSTIFLDEIADIPLSIQAKLLRVLQEKEIQPLGQTGTKKIDVRVLASTNKNLEDKIKRGEFREDLFYRLNVMTVTMPPLQERQSDIPLLSQYFLELYRREYNRPELEFSPESLLCLMNRHWPGNVRELANSINQAVLLCDSKIIIPEDFPSTQDCREIAGGKIPITLECLFPLPYKQAKENLLNYFTPAYLGKALATSAGNVSAAAHHSGMERQALQRLMRRHGIKSNSFRS